MNRKQKTKINIIFTFALEIVTVISGFIIPRLVISSFGSDINGVTSSIADFIGYVSLLQTGVGSAIKAALYKPLAQKDHNTLCIIVKTTKRFFNRLAIFTAVYIFLLALLFQPLLAKEYSYYFTLILVLIIGIGTVAQYFFGITYQMLLEADQKSYIYSIIQMLTIIFNTIAVCIAVKLDASIIIVKACSAFFFVLRPLILSIYTIKKYKLNNSCKVDNSYIKQRWNAFGQGIAFFIHSKTDIFVLTVLSTFSNVSIYGVYVLVTKGLSSVLNGMEKAIRSAFGNIIANNENKALQVTFKSYLTLIHMISTVCFATASVTVFEFIKIYTIKVSDANYIQPIFGIIIIAAEFLYCLRLPYYTIIYAAGKFKETQFSAYIEAAINVILSILLVYLYGLIGVAIGTFVAMLYRTISFIVFLHSQVLSLKYGEQCKRYFITILLYITSIVIGRLITVSVSSYFTWALYTMIVFIVIGAFTFIVNILLDNKNTMAAIKMVTKRK